MGAIMKRPVTKTAKGAHHVRSDPGWQNKPGYRTPPKEELEKNRKNREKEAARRRQEEKFGIQPNQPAEKGIIDKIIDWFLRRK
jgi:hypothetical protein